MPPRTLVLLMCSFLGLTLLGMHGLAPLLPTFIREWGLSNTAAGWLYGANYVAYLAVTPLTTITDRVDARRVLLAGALVNVVGYAGFGLLADGLASALAFRALQGIGLGLSYMPGIKAIADRIHGPAQARATAVYVSSFAICSSLSIAVAGWVADAAGWRWALAVPAASNLLAAMLVLRLAPATPAPPAQGQRPALLDFRPVLARPSVIGHVVAGFAHSFELAALRAWAVTFLGFAWALHPASAPAWNLAVVGTVLILIGVPSGMLGGALGARHGPARVSCVAMLASGAVALTVGFAVSWPFWAFLLGPLLLHNLLVLADAGTLSAGTIQASDPRFKGATVALYSFANALGGFAGPVAFGAILDLAGGRADRTAWGLAFAAIGLAVAAGALALAWLARAWAPPEPAEAR